MRHRMIYLLALSLVFVVYCTRKNSSSPSTERTRVVNLAIWSNYLSPSILADFQTKTGITVQVSHYSSNEELIAKLQAGGSGYDVVLPSDYMIYALIQSGLLQPIHFNLLPNARLIDRKFFNKPYDPENRYSVPYDWGTTGIAVNRSLYSGPLRSWKDLFEKKELAGKFSLLDDAREVIGAALKSKGKSLNSTNLEELKEAKSLLLQLKKNVKTFTSEPLMPLANGELAAAHIYSSDALQVRRTLQGQIEYVIPAEGGTFWIDSWVIPTGAKHSEEAHAFINFLLEERSSVSTVMNVMVATTNRGTFALLPSEYQKNSMLFPSAEQLKHSEMIQDIGRAAAEWDRLWTEFKAQRD